MSAEQLDPLKHKFDEVGSDVLTALDGMFPPPPPRAGWYAKGKQEDPQPDRDTSALLRDHHEKDARLLKLWQEVNAAPEWVDWDQIKRGIARYDSSYRPAETLVRTGGHSAKVAKNRLFETFQLLLQVTKPLEDIKPGGEGFTSAVRVRLLHAAVRSRILKLNAQRPGYFDVDKYGVPINELDSMQSVCAFSTNLVWLALPRQGIYVRHQEALDYLALWRWVGYILGTPHWILATPERALASMESLLKACLAPSKNSRALANLVIALDGVAPIHEPKEFFKAGTRFINGDKMCDDVGLGKPGLYWDAVIRGIIWTLIVITYMSRSIPAWDRWQIRTFRALFWDYIAENKDNLKGGYKHEFKYVPHHDAKTGAETAGGPRPTNGIGHLEIFGLVGFSVVVLLATGLLTMVAKLGFLYAASNPLQAIVAESPLKP
ncbi:tat pathway signal sequence [Colletotrichum salicis]|uniref:Tat pathway signal sequence n=1 Tax=Colletotrichum salicis TaxID=1209931 RepID=A0A135UPS8_9PEZI|nr:tat pathway signal sequence [Colletotrichum salicis]